MARIFIFLASLDGLALAACFSLGSIFKVLAIGGLSKEWTHLLHFHLGLYSVIGNLGVHCLVFIYFLGTGRWVKEVALAYELPDAPLPRLTRDLKRRTFPPALFAMLVPIATAAAGVGADLGLSVWPWPVHFTLALTTLLINLWAFRVEYRNIRTNGGVIDDVLREVDRIRAERGLPTNAEALQQEGSL